jgi:hypothetical protein
VRRKPRTLQVLDVSVNRLCWIVTCPFFHCGSCPYQTGTYVCSFFCNRAPPPSLVSASHAAYPYSCPSHTKKVLYLREHDVERHDRNLCGSRSSTRPYQQLGHGGVVVSSCCCLVCADSALGTILPGSGCDRDAVNIIAQTLRERQQQQNHNSSSSGNRWHTGSHQLADRTEALERKMDVILDHLLVLAATRRNTEQHLPTVEPGPAFAMSMSER